MRAALWVRNRTKPGGTCECYWYHCVLSKRRMTLDHFIPLCKGGEDVIQNCVPACEACNQRRGEIDNPACPQRPKKGDERFFLDLNFKTRREEFAK